MWYILWPFGIFFIFGTLYQKKTLATLADFGGFNVIKEKKLEDQSCRSNACKSAPMFCSIRGS
jgi:hypothetical protein